MYYPYFRGKQFELITIRETAELLAKSGFIPIIEPVRETLSGLDRTLNTICEKRGEAIIIVNPQHGDHATSGECISTFLKERFKDSPSISAGILLKDKTTIEEVLQCYKEHKDHHPTFIHAGFTDPKSLSDVLNENLKETTHIFVEKYCGKIYQKHFRNCKRILLRDGFRRRRNADHPPIEKFSDLHVTFSDEGMNGFGDFLIVGDEYTEGGGPAYAVAIHLTFIDGDKEDVMFTYHFVSKTNDTPTDPAGKFAQALSKLITKLDSKTSKLLETTAIKEFRDLHQKKHFPGLGHVKKLSMKHHIETLADFIKNNR
ncbi:sce7725 family protein [Chromobacterium haemolyticum]|uniref:sce7725 family protein n=1 Tax=Chromobacterium haemolyticum TaxID=394935 RepID=UPI002446A87B|nr:sce7725 family protein [Chromobacterium haemolyticum]MDH0340339.1 sce7725 family protein [Chromobacterium haemolyticum]